MNLEVHLAALRHNTTVASLNYDIWWVYKSKAPRERHTPTMNRYLSFFETSIHAHFVALLVALYPLYETRGDTHNIPSLLRQLEKLPRFSVTALERARKHMAEAKPLWVKVGVLRNEAFGHKSANSTIAEAFAKAGITPDQLKELVEITKRLLNVVSKEHDGSVHAFNLEATESTMRVLNDLSLVGAG